MRIRRLLSSVRLLLHSRLLAVTFWGSRKLYGDFQLHGAGNAPVTPTVLKGQLSSWSFAILGSLVRVCRVIALPSSTFGEDSLERQLMQAEEMALSLFKICPLSRPLLPSALFTMSQPCRCWETALPPPCVSLPPA